MPMRFGGSQDVWANRIFGAARMVGVRIQVSGSKSPNPRPNMAYAICGCPDFAVDFADVVLADSYLRGFVSPISITAAVAMDRESLASCAPSILYST
jgi:hypothetical protein